MADPYLYRGTDVLKNLLGIQDRAVLEAFENAATAQRMAEGLPSVALDKDGYCRLHFHLFQDVYDWAGEIRRVDISKPGALFRRFEYIDRELSLRFARLRNQNWLRGSTPDHFVSAVAEHLSELNAIHPFREGNGRTLRVLLRVLGEQARHPMAIERIVPKLWNAASRESFRNGRTDLFCEIIHACRMPPRGSAT